MRSAIKFLLIVAMCNSCFGSKIPEDVLKSIVFIYKDAAGTPSQADGTGFLVSIPHPTIQGRSWVYLVTAKHVLHTDSNNLNSPLYSKLFVRVNKKDGGSVIEVLDITTSGQNQVVFFHADPTVDVAVISIGKDDPSYDLLTMPESFLATTDDLKKYNIGVGTDMFFAGMFVPFQGQKKSYPITRFGKLAMIPDEKVRFGNEDIAALLVETFSFGGNSGSPVFFYPGSDNTPGVISIGPSVLKIAGLMKGYFGDIEPIAMIQIESSAGQSIPVSKGNSGIAAVVPAWQISEILHSAILEKNRTVHP